jgi:hypothetical protein
VNRVFGPEGPKADESGDFNNALVQWKPSMNQQFSLFYHDFKFNHWAARSSETLGADYLGAFVYHSEQKLQLHLAFATQQEGDNSPADFLHSYARADANWKIKALHFEAGVERLGGDGKTAMQTPLATLHAFNGFADNFLSTPVNGLQDQWLGAGYVLRGKCQLSAQYHRYNSDKGSLHYGDEINLSATHSLGKQLQLMAKVARYSANEFAQDTNKLWLNLSYSL